MRELVNNHILEHLRRHHHEPPRKVQVSASGAGSPARLRVLDRDAVGRHPQSQAPTRASLADLFPCEFFQESLQEPRRFGARAAWHNQNDAFVCRDEFCAGDVGPSQQNIPLGPAKKHAIVGRPRSVLLDHPNDPPLVLGQSAPAPFLGRAPRKHELHPFVVHVNSNSLGSFTVPKRDRYVFT